MKKQWRVYVHINKVNGKRYVGITSKTKVEYRWGFDGYGYKKNPRFYSAIMKYGWDNFDHIILAEQLTESEAKDMEMRLIEEWKTMDLDYGYNLTSGGDGTRGYYPSAETRVKLSVARKKENLFEETLRRRSEGLRGRKFTDDHKRKIGKSNSKPVDMLTLDGIYIRTFPSAHCAEVELGINHSHISQCCNKRRSSTGGYTWRFAQ